MSYPNPQQQAVLDHRAGALLVLAPAGTGKTRVMADRLAAAIAAGMPADQTLGVTFTNRAAEHMRQMVAATCGAAARRCRIQTFHSLCAWILRLEARDLGIPPDFVIYDEQDGIDLLRHCLPETHQSNAQNVFYDLSTRKSACPQRELRLADVPRFRDDDLAPDMRRAFQSYHQHLAARNALDFSDLLYRTRAMFANLPAKRAKWSSRFRWIQLDEAQDTHLSEYEVIRLLGSAAALAFFGDLDQTIYQWRGSRPMDVIRHFKADFAPVTELPLLANYRATRRLLDVCNRHAASFNHRHTRTTPAPTLAAGTSPECHRSDNAHEEAQWIARRLHALSRSDPSQRIGILTRTHQRSQTISTVLTQHGIPHLTVEQFEFFRRQEIKDLLARLRLLLNPADHGALLRLIERPACGIGAAGLRKLWDEGLQCGLRLTDLARAICHHHAEPFACLLDALDHGTVVVLDTETTGLTTDDEVIEIAAIRITAGVAAESFEALLRPTRPLDASAAIHGITPEMLDRDGRDPAAAFRDFAAFIEGAVVAGHNVGFDVAMLQAHAGRTGTPLDIPLWFDTLDLARRLLTLERYDLASVCAGLDTPAQPSHRALADVLATADVLQKLAARLDPGAAKRRQLVARHAATFRTIADRLAAWRELARRERPADLCARIMIESGLAAFYQDEPRRLANLSQFTDFFSRNDEPARAPLEMLGELTRRVALSKNLDFLAADDQSTPVLTVHQSKGLEFDVVFIAGVTEDEFPSYYARRDGTEEEEKRLFYVALTRAKEHLILTCHQQNERGYFKGPSRFLRCLSGTGCGLGDAD